MHGEVTICSACRDGPDSSCFPGVVTGSSGSLSGRPWLIGASECGGGCVCRAQESAAHSVSQRSLQTPEFAGALALEKRVRLTLRPAARRPSLSLSRTGLHSEGGGPVVGTRKGASI